jgi:biotin carboxylase
MAMARIAHALHARTPLSGVLCWDEARIHAAAHVAGALGLRNGNPEIIMRMRDKGQTRAALDSAGVAQPRSVPVRTLDEAAEAAERIGYPVVLKPRDLGASLGVARVDGPEQLASTFRFTWHTRGPEAQPLGPDGSVLVEECVIGQEISVDSVVQDGTLTPLFVARKVVGYPPYAEEVGHYVHGDDPLLNDPAIVEILRESHAALGFRDGCTHTEIMMTAGGPKIIEINGRIGGDVIPYIGRLATGIDAGVVAASVACGLPLDLTRTRGRVAGVRFFYPEREHTKIAFVGFEERDLPKAVDRLVPIAQPGTVASPPPLGTWWGRVAYATAVADTVEDCELAIKAAQSALTIETDVHDIRTGPDAPPDHRRSATDHKRADPE